MDNKYLRKIKKPIILLFLGVFVISCSIGTGFRVNEISSFKGTIIPELSDEPILIEKVSIDLIEKEKNKIPLNLPLNLLNYSPVSYKVGYGDVLLFMFTVKQKDCRRP